MTTWYSRVRVFASSLDSGYVHQRKIDLEGWRDSPRFAAYAVGLANALTKEEIDSLTEQTAERRISRLENNGVSIFVLDDDSVLTDSEDLFFGGVAKTKDLALLRYVQGEGEADFVVDQWSEEQQL